MNKNDLPVVVIIGAGFGGLNAARNLRNAPVNVILVDKNNYHLFQPLLYQVATAVLAPSEIAYPVRKVFHRQENFEFRLAEVVGIDFNARLVQTSTGAIRYDYLVLSMGSETNYFGMNSIEEHGFTLKDLNNAESIRNHILRSFELSTQEEDPVICKALRTFVIVGGGPTGVECSGALSELTRLVLGKDYPQLNTNKVEIILLEMTDRLLPGFPEELSRNAVKTLQSKGVEVRLNTAVADYDGKQVFLKDGSVIPTYTLIWAAGVKAESLTGRLGVPLGRQARIQVENTLQLPDHPEVFVIGDAAYLENQGKALPMLAPVAIQEAKTAIKNITNMIQGKKLTPFEYKDPGTLATIGRNSAVARVKNFDFTGFPAWVVWLGVHIFWLIGFRNRILVMINWAYDYFFYDRAVRLIVPSHSLKENLPELMPQADPSQEVHSTDHH